MQVVPSTARLGHHVPVLNQWKERFSNRGILKHLKWLDVRMWPEEDDVAAVAAFAVANLEALFNHWKDQLSRWEAILAALKANWRCFGDKWYPPPLPRAGGV